MGEPHIRIFFASFVLFLLYGQSFALFWRATSAPTLPADPNDQYYKEFQQVPPPNITTKKFMNNFLHISTPLGVTKRSSPFSTEDNVIVFDGSGSIGTCEFKKGKQALENMMGRLNNPKIDTKYAAVTFASSATVNFKFLKYSSAASKIANIPYPRGLTNTQAGLAEAKKLFDDPSSGRRENARKVVLLITDGQSNVKKNETIPKAQVLKNSGATVFVVAVGSYISGIDEMVRIASAPPENHVFRVSKLKGFLEIIALAIKKVSPGDYHIVKGQFENPC